MADPRAHAQPQTDEPIDDGFGDDPLAELTRIVSERTPPQPSWTPPSPGGRFGRATPQASATASRQPASARLPAMEPYVPPPEPEPLPPPVMRAPEPEPEFELAPEPQPVVAPAPAPRPQVRPLFPTAAQAALDARSTSTASVAQQSYAFFAEQRSRGAAPRSLGDPELPGGAGRAEELEDPLAELARLASDPALFESSFRRAGQTAAPQPSPAYDPVAEEDAGLYDDSHLDPRGAPGRDIPFAGATAGRGYHDDDAEDLARNEAPVATSTVDAYVPGDLESHAVPEVDDVHPMRMQPLRTSDVYADDDWDPTPVARSHQPAEPDADPYYDDAPVWRDPVEGDVLATPASLSPDMPTIPGEEESRRPRFGGMRGVGIVVGVLAVAVVTLVGYRMVSGGISNGPPQVFEDDGLPAKGPPETASAENEETDTPGKTIYDRVDGTTDTQSARLVERATAPVDALPGVGGAAATGGDGETVMEPRRVRTVVVRPDGTIVPGQTTDPRAVPETAADTLPEPVPAADRNAMSDLVASGGTAAASAESQVATEAAEVEQALASEPVGTTQGPLRLPERRPAAPAVRTTTATTPATQPQTAAAPARTAGAPMALVPGSSTAPAAATTQTATAPAGSYMVQVTSQRSRDQALAAYQQLQRKFPSVLGGRAPSLQSVEISGKGTYYRVRVPGGSQAQAAQLCSQLKAAGGDCVVTRN
ncbi:SPOR domain-containing protein [Segnochrobactraceae bacterium EtOH-i3]